jgi:hypothetical protein
MVASAAGITRPSRIARSSAETRVTGKWAVQESNLQPWD